MAKQFAPGSSTEFLAPYGSIEYGNLMAKVGDMDPIKVAHAGAEKRRAVRLVTAKA